jgi:hypothetical protein
MMNYPEAFDTPLSNKECETVLVGGVMNRTFAYVLSACALVVLFAGGTLMQRASAQNATQFPGQPTRASVWIQNRGDKEAVPVSIENVSTESALRVAVAGIPRVTLDPAGIVQVRATRQAWGYRAVSVGAGQDPTAVLNSAGADGWETTGVAISAGGTTVIVLKRPI